MNECESIRTAMSTMVSRFKHLIQAKYYDNRCNLATSMLLRFPCITEETIIMGDRFLYRGQKCKTVTDTNSYVRFNDHKTSGAESINQQWNFTKKHVRYLSPDYLILYVDVRSVFLNV